MDGAFHFSWNNVHTLLHNQTGGKASSQGLQETILLLKRENRKDEQMTEPNEYRKQIEELQLALGMLKFDYRKLSHGRISIDGVLYRSLVEGTRMLISLVIDVIDLLDLQVEEENADEANEERFLDGPEANDI